MRVEYASVMRALAEAAHDLCDGRMVCTLEGGYDPEVVAAGVVAALSVLEDVGCTTEDPFGPSPNDNVDVTSLRDDLTQRHGL